MSPSAPDPRFTMREISPGTPEYEAAACVRYEALYAPWELPRELIADTDGRTYRHLAAFATDGVLVGYARIWLDCGESKIFQVAVDEAWRGAGVGSALVRELMKMAAREGRDEVVLDSRDYATSFYERLGFVIEGDEFLSGRTNTPHRAMRARLRGCAFG